MQPHKKPLKPISHQTCYPGWTLWGRHGPPWWNALINISAETQQLFSSCYNWHYFCFLEFIVKDQEESNGLKYCLLMKTLLNPWTDPVENAILCSSCSVEKSCQSQMLAVSFWNKLINPYSPWLNTSTYCVLQPGLPIFFFFSLSMFTPNGASLYRPDKHVCSHLFSQ